MSPPKSNTFLDPRFAASALVPRATLIHNAYAAGHFRLSTERILKLLREAGYDARHVPTGSEAELAAVLTDPGDLVVAAGGDGTIRGVALTLASRNPSVPLALAPLGTANNIARTLGLTDTTETLLRGLATPRKRPFDLGFVRAPWGEARFLEAFGFGLFAHGMEQYAPDGGKSLFRAVRAALSTFARYEAKEWRLELDGHDRSGRYLMIEIMNTAAMGLRLRLAPDADPGDGLLEVVLVHEDATVGPYAYLKELVVGNLLRLPNVEVVQGKKLKIDWDGSPLHFDEEVRGDDDGSVAGGEVCIEIQAGALEFWLPQTSEPASSKPY